MRHRSTQRPGARAVSAGVVVLVAVWSFAASVSLARAAPAAPAAPASCPQPLLDRYEPGDEVTIVGYTNGCAPDPPESAAGGREPLFGYLHPDPCIEVDPTTRPQMCNAAALYRRDPPVDVASGTPVGRFTVADTIHRPRGLRLSLTFELPPDLVAGIYYVLICQDPCVDLGGSFYALPWAINVGVDPAGGRGPVRQWPLDDPAIADLPDDALLLDRHGDEITAAEVRAEAQAAAEAATAAEDDVADRDRVETAETRDGRDNGAPQALWVVAAVVVIAAGWALARMGGARKQIRQKP